jgi:DNA-binding phage protein|nr:MAG TPA: helix-turn-helix domain protein [Caudoviricetes sp.]
MQNRKFATFFCAVQTFVAYCAKKCLTFGNGEAILQVLHDMRQKGVKSVNVAKFKAAIVERGTSVVELADAVGLSKSTLYRKINTGGDDFTIGEVLSITKALHLSADEGQQIFFAQNVAQDATVKE